MSWTPKNWVKWSTFQFNLTTFVIVIFSDNFGGLKFSYMCQKNESCQINLKDTSFDSVFCADPESVFCFWLKALFEFENRWIPPKMVMIPVKTIFLDKEKKKKQVMRNFFTVVWWIKWDKIIFITYVEKLDKFTKSTYT